MNPKTDSTPEAVAAAQAVTSPRKPRFSLFIATAAGLGYLPKAPGTWGSLAGVAIAHAMNHFDLIVILAISALFGRKINDFPIAVPYVFLTHPFLQNFVPSAFIFLVIALLGVFAAGRVEKFSRVKDPQFVVIDEVSGQHLTLLLGGMLPLTNLFGLPPRAPWSAILFPRHPGWIILLAGLILFRVFDIWKPFPARQAESLPGGWGIMADDWVAGIYAAIGLWIARAAGL